MTKIRIVLADDHPLIRAGFRSLLGQSDDVEIVGEAEDGVELVDIVEGSKPDVVLMDISMPRMNGLDAMVRLLKDHPLLRFIILTMHEEREYVLQAIKSGASGYLLKNVDRFELENAISTVHKGDKYFSPFITNILAEAVTKPEPAEPVDLTPREREILQLVSEGKSTKLIADMLKISIRTVESHRINMLKKWKVNNTAELIKKAFELKLIH